MSDLVNRADAMANLEAIRSNDLLHGSLWDDIGLAIESVDALPVDATIAHLRAVIEEARADLVRIKYDANQGWLGAVQGRIESLQSVLAKAEEGA
jgi:hypothetical protein